METVLDLRLASGEDGGFGTGGSWVSSLILELLSSLSLIVDPMSGFLRRERESERDYTFWFFRFLVFIFYFFNRWCS